MALLMVALNGFEFIDNQTMTSGQHLAIFSCCKPHCLCISAGYQVRETYLSHWCFLISIQAIRLR